ncbi:CPBP family intramembrane glutamic endopeptidase [Bacillus sp. FJAT-27231]|uniref:CPBP family intramembrane glutamic endopeptidase n=1 Tax=Bacillus sp. FJAT-27231 TaxID=1679168 RepID=UPI000ADE772A|nr:type II CAAX endopeptidase family protein [Bacillus sp. FJAT-27231]
MNIDHTFVRNAVCLSLFVLLIVSLQTKSYFLICLWILCSIFLFIYFNKSIRLFVITNILFGIGFFMYLYINSHWVIHIEAKELNIFLNRFSLVIILTLLAIPALFSRSPFIKYWRKAEWNGFIHFPFIWSGFHQAKVKFFLLIAIIVNVLIFTPFIVLNGWSFIREIWFLAIVFSTTNALLEELIWRGALLSRFSEQFGEKWAVVITSLGFGLQHYSLGFPWLVCIAFSIGGMFYGGMTIKSKSIIPSVVWHIVLNILMVLSGFILK